LFGCASLRPTLEFFALIFALVSLNLYYFLCNYIKNSKKTFRASQLALLVSCHPSFGCASLRPTLEFFALNFALVSLNLYYLLCNYIKNSKKTFRASQLALLVSCHPPFGCASLRATLKFFALNFTLVAFNLRLVSLN
jgi:hypothetical protein